jgi:hypothetical protein
MGICTHLNTAVNAGEAYGPLTLILRLGPHRPGVPAHRLGDGDLRYGHLMRRLPP